MLALFFVDSDRVRSLLDRHIRSCPNCRREIEFQQSLSARLKAEVPAPFQDTALHARIMRSLESARPEPSSAGGFLKPAGILGLSGVLGVLLVLLFLDLDQPRESFQPSQLPSFPASVQSDPMPFINSTVTEGIVPLELEIAHFKEDLMRAAEILQGPFRRHLASFAHENPSYLPSARQP